MSNNLEFSRRNNLEKLFDLQKDINTFIKEQKPNWRTDIKAIFQRFLDILRYKYFLFSLFIFSASLILFYFSKKAYDGIPDKTQALELAVLLTIELLFIVLSQFSIYLIILLSDLIPDLKRKTKIKQDIRYTEISTIDKFVKKLLFKKYSLLELKYEEENLKENLAKNEKIQQSLPISLLIFILGSLYIMEYMIGISAQNIIDAFPTVFKGLSFFIVITVIFPLFFKADYFSNIKFQKQALTALKKAQILHEREKVQKNLSIENINEKYESILQELQNITKEIKKDNKPSSINKNTKKGSLMKKLMEIKTIEAPEDFSTNFDSYQSGDKGAGTDIY